ncbi:hypothetical protein AaE_010181 [Aphanomyces astaci]|uniref:Uncharacterized protein n=1 Tax=Aphanomyces astaci TaxID=112090 RepID=A0A6A5AAC5_APHAT|nr:hypothetical protein AaE_010181 [Aphanomyces astaci]
MCGGKTSIVNLALVLVAVAAITTTSHCIACDDDISLGYNIDDVYELSNEILGEGATAYDVSHTTAHNVVYIRGYCVVRKARHRGTNEVVAVKELAKKDISSKAFWTEVEMLHIAGSHPNIVSLRGVFETDTTWYIVQELANGGELFDHLVANGAYSEKQASVGMRDLCHAMVHLHRKGIVHGDVKPENIMLCEDRMCLVDFGVSFRQGERPSDAPLQATTAYCAPETLAASARNEFSSGPEADMFALGVVLYILLCGCHPFDTHNTLTDDEIGRRILKGSFNTKIRPWKYLTRDAQDLLRRLLDADPQKRLTADQALAHPWLSPSNNRISTLKRPATALKRFQRGRKRLRASILAVLLQRDESSTSTRDPSELRELARGLSSKPEAAAPKAAMVASALEVFDRDSKGYISGSDLKRVTTALGHDLSDGEIRDMIGSAGGDPDEVHIKELIQYQDIQRMISSLRSALYAQGDVVSEEGAIDPHFYVLMEGRVDVVCKNAIAPDSNSNVLKLLVDDFSTVSAIYKSMDDRFQEYALHHAHTQIIKCLEDTHGHVQRQAYAEGEVVYKQGDHWDSYFIVTSGAVEVVMDDVVVEHLGAGDYFPLGVVSRLASPPIRHASVRATEPTTVVEIQGHTFRSFLRSYRFMTAYFEDQKLQRQAQRRVARKKHS